MRRSRLSRPGQPWGWRRERTGGNGERGEGTRALDAGVAAPLANGPERDEDANQEDRRNRDPLCPSARNRALPNVPTRVSLMIRLTFRGMAEGAAGHRVWCTLQARALPPGANLGGVFVIVLVGIAGDEGADIRGHGVGRGQGAKQGEELLVGLEEVSLDGVE